MKKADLLAVVKLRGLSFGIIGEKSAMESVESPEDGLVFSDAI